MSNSKVNINVDDFKLEYTKVEQIVPKLEILRKGFNSNKTKDLAFRKSQLNKLRSALVKYDKEINRSNYLDLNFSEFSSHFNNNALILKEVDYIISHFEEWAQPRSADTPVLFAPSKSYLYPEPFGVCLIFSAWNFQWHTLIGPLAAAIAAGNAVLAKPSEMAPFSAKLVEYILEELDPEVVQIVQGGADQCIELTKNKTDFIVFTGSPMKGKLVAKAAADHLIPCILELGGQNPVVVDETADIKCAAYNIVNGRFSNCGQICIGPEYILVHRSKYDILVHALKETTVQFFSSDPKTSSDYGRVINEWHSERLANLTKNHGGELVIGGECDIKQKYVPPTIVKFSSISDLSKSELAKEEIFGPILYLAPYDSFNECIEYIKSKEKPLVLYYFGFDSTNKESLKHKTSSGALMYNDTVIHFANHYLPFGGVGTSGYGAYHGKFGFDSLSHLKPVMDRGSTVVPFRYPPFTNSKQSVMRKLLKLDFSQNSALSKLCYVAILLIAIYLRHNIYSGLNGFYNGFKNGK